MKLHRKPQALRSTCLYNSFGITAEIEITKYEKWHENICLIFVETLECVEQSSSPTLAINRWKLLTGLQVACVMEQVNIDKVKCRSVYRPARSQEAFVAPLAFGEELLREFRLFLGRYRLNVAGMNHLPVDRLKLVR